MRLGDMLLKAGVISELQLHAAVAEQHRHGGKLGETLVRMGALSEELLVMALARQLDLPRVDLAQVVAVPDDLKTRVDKATCEQYRVLPLAYVAERRAVQLAMSDPFDVVALDDLTRRLGTRIEPFLVGDRALAAAIRRLYTATSSASLSHGADLDLVDNAGRPITGAMPVGGPAPASQPPSAAAASYLARVEEQSTAVRAVAELLVERGFIRWEELGRRA
jgi:hypothetical protein